jgi:hypothetical protein
MLHDLLSSYLNSIDSAVRNLRNAYIEIYEEEVLTNSRVNLRIRARFQNGFLLEINEAVIIEEGQIKHLGYRYHFQDKLNNVVFRYDNTPHFPKFKTFPHHKHLQKEVVDSEKPLISAIIDEANLIATQTQT